MYENVTLGKQPFQGDVLGSNPADHRGSFAFVGPEYNPITAYRLPSASKIS